MALAATTVPVPEVHIGLNPAQHKALIEMLNPKRAERAMKAAVRSAINKSIVMMIKHLMTVLAIDKKGIKGDQSRPTFGKPGGPTKISEFLRINYRPVRAIKFKFVSPRNRLKNQNKIPGGVTIHFRHGSGVQIESAFIGRVRFQPKGEGVPEGRSKAVLLRYGEKVPGKKQKIKQAYGPSVMSLLAPQELTALGRMLIENSKELFKKELASKIDWVLKRKKTDPPIAPIIE